MPDEVLFLLPRPSSVASVRLINSFEIILLKIKFPDRAVAFLIKSDFRPEI